MGLTCSPVARLASISLICLATSAAVAQIADPVSDAPEYSIRTQSFKHAPSYSRVLEAWRTPEDVNEWMGARFEYSTTRAMLLSETHRSSGARLAIHEPEVFFTAPSGICVDLARFAVETLRHIDASLNARYLMLEFEPVTIGGNTLRLHWLASFIRDGSLYFFADSKRPGHIAGPYGTTQEFIDQYAAYRGRQVVAFRELDSYQRRQRSFAIRQERVERP